MANKTSKAIEELQKYIRNIPEKEKERIKRELEQDRISNGEAVAQIKYFAQPYVYKISSKGAHAYYTTASTAQSGGFIFSDNWENAPKNIVEEDVQDVSFE